MLPANSETIISLGHEYTEEIKLQPASKTQQEQAVELLKEMPQEIMRKFSNIVLDRLFPELQLDARVQVAMEWYEDEPIMDEDGQKIPAPMVKSNVIDEIVPIEEIGDHWILPTGEQITRSTGAVYFHKPLSERENRNDSLLFWDLDQMRGFLESEDPAILKIKLERTQTSKSDQQIDETITTLVYDPYESQHPESLAEPPKAYISESQSKVPTILKAEGATLADRVWDKIGGHIAQNNDYIFSQDDLFHENNYSPVLLSNDLIILVANTGDFYEIFAKEVHSRTGEEIWHHKKFTESEEAPAEIAQWLAGLEKRDNNGRYVYGYKTAALATVR